MMSTEKISKNLTPAAGRTFAAAEDAGTLEGGREDRHMRAEAA